MGKRTSKVVQSSGTADAAATSTDLDENALNQAPTSGVEVRPVDDRDNFPELSGDADDNTVIAGSDPDATVILDSRSLDLGGSADASAATTTDAEVTPEDIEQTRAEMSRTIDAIKEKLNPETLKEHAKEAIKDATVHKVEDVVHNAVDSAKEAASNVWESAREKMHDAGHSAKGAGNSMIDMIKENPIPAAMAGLGIGWLIASMRTSDRYDYTSSRATNYSSTAYPSGYRRDYTSDYSGTSYPRSYESGRYSATYYDTRNEDANRVASDYGAENTGAGTYQGQPYQGSSYSAPSYNVEREDRGVFDVVKENPIPAALAGLGIGWLIASARSSSGGSEYRADRYDYRTTGSYDSAGRYYGGGSLSTEADQAGLRDRATDMAHGAKERVSDIADSAKERVGDATERVGEMAHDAKERVSEMAHDARERVGEFAHEAKERVSDVAGSAWDRADRYVVTPVKENPIPAALIGIGIGWMIASMRRGDQNEYRPYESERFGSATYDRGGGTGGAEYRSGGYPYEENRFGASGTESDRSIRDRVSDVAGSARERVGDVAESVGETASHLRDRVSNTASDLSYRARETAHRATDGLERTLNDNPFAIAAMALVLGVGVGLALPETQHENRWMGETRDRLVDQVSEKAKNVATRVQDVAEDALNTAKSAAGDALNSAKTAAGTAVSSVKAEVKDVTRDAFATAKSEVKDELSSS